jgi:hypothetical protein
MASFKPHFVGTIALMMEATRTSETLVNFYQSTRRYNPEDSHLRSQRRENLKSYLINIKFMQVMPLTTHHGQHQLTFKLRCFEKF